MGRWAREFSEDDRKKIKAMAGYGIPQDDIAKVMECDKKTLRKHCQKELDVGSAIATAKVAESLYNQALSGNTAAMIFWMKCRAGWAERHEISGPNGGGIEITINRKDARAL